MKVESLAPKYNTGRAIITALLIIAVFAVDFINVRSLEAQENNSKMKFDYVLREGTYDNYLNSYFDAKRPEKEIGIDIFSYSDAKETEIVFAEYEDEDDVQAVLVSERGFTQWEFNVENAGLYNIEIEYFPVEGRNSAIERELRINGEIPFMEARNLSFSRIYIDDGPIRQDSRGNDIRPSQIEYPFWRSVLVRDSIGYYDEPFRFFFDEGINTLSLNSIREPMLIGSITLKQAPEIPDYSSVKEKYEEAGYTKTQNQFIKVQGQVPLYKSDPTLYPTYDRSSPLTEPYHHSRLKLNTIGSEGKWALPGQWIQWELDVEKAGLYKIGIKARQDVYRGVYTNRRIYINDEIPFREAGNIKFFYSYDFNMYIPGNGREDFMFYFEEGTNTIKLETSLGSEMSEILRVTEDSVFELNRIYRKMLMLMGATPDPLRDYQLERRMPDEIQALARQSEIIAFLSEALQNYTGQRGSHVAILDRLSLQLKDMSERPHTIPSRFRMYKDNVGALGTWILRTREQPLEIDYIVVASPEMDMPRTRARIGERIIHEIRMFIATFFENYELIGDIHEDDESLQVWLGTGRDQAAIIRQMIDDTFMQESGIPVNLRLVDINALLPSTLAGLGPDVALSIGIELPVNFAMRNAVEDLAQFKDFPEVAERFHESAITPLQYLEGVYALPETQFFPMMFYRRDIFEEQGLEIPQTWDDVVTLIPELQKNYMDFGMQSGLGATIVQDATGMGTYAMFLYQNGGKFYRDGGIATDLDSETAIRSFTQFADFYISYRLPVTFDFHNRFRVGEIPIAIMDYNAYNQMVVFAPEIRGLWDFVPVPGTLQPDGTIDRSVASNGQATIMMSQTDKKQESWEFMKWWTRADTSVRFGREMESLMGAAARHPTANLEAVEDMPWSADNIKNLQEQWQWVKGIPRVPGSYYVPRLFDFALRGVVLQGEDIRERLADAVRDMNDEITIKRREFGLDTMEERDE